MFFQCRTQYGINTVFRTYTTDEPLAEFLTFKTGDIDFPPQSSTGFSAYDGTAVNGSTDGNIVQNFKLQKVKEVKVKSAVLRREGIIFQTVLFSLGTQSIAIMALLQANGNLTGQIFPLKLGEYYTFTNDMDATDLLNDMIARLNSIYGGEETLLNSITAAANTQVAMDAIVDNRT